MDRSTCTATSSWWTSRAHFGSWTRACCGRSGNQPLCDGTHLVAGFHDVGALSAESNVQDSGVRGKKLRVHPVPDGPLELEGSFALVSADHRTTLEGDRARLCRCGQSRTKPFCDGTHQRTGF